MACADVVAAVAAGGRQGGRRGRHRLRAGVRLEHRLRNALQHYRGRHGRIRRESARCDGRRLPRIPLAHRGLPRPADTRRASLRGRVHPRSARGKAQSSAAGRSARIMTPGQTRRHASVASDGGEPGGHAERVASS